MITTRFWRGHRAGSAAIMGADRGDGHHVFHDDAVLGAINALRWRFDRAFRAAFGH